MLRTSLRTRAVAAVTALAIAGGGSLLLAPPASAAPAAVVLATSAQKFITSDVGADQALNTVTLTEAAVGDITVGDIFLQLAAPAGTKWGTAVPTASENNATLALGAAVRVDDNTIKIPVTTASTVNPATVTITGLLVNTDAGDATNRGPITIAAGTTDNGTEYEAATRVGFQGVIDRLQGSNRYATAQTIAEKGGCNANAIIARGDNFPDALAASYLAGKTNAPILLVASTSLPTETQAALRALGTTSVQIIGGLAAVSQGVEDAIKALPTFSCPGGAQLAPTISVGRIQGADRYFTAKSVALQGASVAPAGAGTFDTDLVGGTCEPIKTAIVASGENFPDALAAGPLAARGSAAGGCGTGALPMLLTQQGSLPVATSGTLTDMGIQQVILMGGTTAVSPAVSTAITGMGIKVYRVSGTTRQDTAKLFATILGTDKLANFTGTTVFVTRPDTFPDALAAGPYAGKLLTGSPIYLTDNTTTLGGTATTGIKAYGGTTTFDKGVLLGGTVALAESVATQLAQAIADQSAS